MIFRTYRSLALKKALTQVGVKESPPDSNSGPRVRIYQAVTGAFRAAWCASFVQWSFCAVGYKQPLLGRSAYVPYILDTARRYGWVVSKAAPGDLACYDWEGDGVCDHIGIVKTKPDVHGTFTAVEGNTTVGNDSNGGEVMVRSRNVAQVRGFIRVPGRKGFPAPKPKPKPPVAKTAAGPRYYTLKKQVPLQDGQTVAYTEKKGYYASPVYYTFQKDVVLKQGQSVKYKKGLGYYAG
jgi:hypothetical protein